MFESGLFFGRLGKERTFLVYDEDKKIKIPTDLAGVTFAGYKGRRRDKNIFAAVGAACDPIRDAIKSHKKRKKDMSIEKSFYQESKLAELKEGLKG